MRTSFFCFILVLLSPVFTDHLFSQEPPPPPIEWGEISKADLEMRSYPADSNASAVILCDYGETTMDKDINLVFKRHLRVKLLNQKGFSWGTHSVVIYNDREHGDDIDDIEGMTYTLSKEGKIVETEFDDDDVFEEKVSDKYTRYKFTLPGLEPGCIIEIRYKITSQSLWSVHDWVMQYEEPIRWSEYRLIIPVNFAFAVLTHGYERLSVNEIYQVPQMIMGAPVTVLGTNPIRCNFQRWVVKDARGLRDEPFITTIDDYVNKLDLQFAGYAVDGYKRQIGDTWEKFIAELLENKYVGDKIDASGRVRDQAEQITRAATSPELKVKAVYSWIANSIVWTGAKRLAADQTMDEILESKKGNSAEINLLLVSMLKALNIPCEPVVLSTRENGKVQDLYPIYNQFNYLLARASVDGKYMYLDATDPIRPMNILPAYVLGVKSIVVREDPVEWITLQSPQKYSTTSLAQIAIDSLGGVTGTLEGIFKEYANISIRKSLIDKKAIDVAKDYFHTETSGLTIDSTAVTGKDSIENNLVMKSWVSSPTYAQVSGEFIYLNPHIISRWTDNPFKSKERKFSIDYNYPREYTSIITIVFPDSFEIKEGLKDKFVSASSDVKYRRQSVINGNMLQITTKFEIARREIPAQFYSQLKDLYGIMISTESEQLVLQRKPKIVIPPPAPPEEPKAAVKKSLSKQKTKK